MSWLNNNNNNNKRFSSPSTAWHWPATRPATPSPEVFLSSATTSTRDPSPAVVARSDRIVADGAASNDSVLEDGLASFFHAGKNEYSKAVAVVVVVVVDINGPIRWPHTHGGHVLPCAIFT